VVSYSVLEKADNLEELVGRELRGKALCRDQRPNIELRIWLLIRNDPTKVLLMGGHDSAIHLSVSSL
jgi:hypothetical protein